MQGKTNPDILKGAWVDLEVAMNDKVQIKPIKLTTAYNGGGFRVETADGTILAYEGEYVGDKLVDNRAKMKGIIIPRNILDRGPIGGEKQYLEPICTDVLAQYRDNGFDGVMTQNPGWEGLK